MSSTRTETVAVPGARLHCEVTGSGPVLLLIAGAAADARVLSGLATRLSGKYRAVTYDMRGLSRSELDGPAEDVGIEALADDAHRILAAFSSEPAYVLGSSGGGLVGLELTARHPEQVRALVAHEPAAMALLPYSQQWQDFVGELEELHRSAGAGAAMGRFLDGIEAVPGPGVAKLGQLATPPAGQPPQVRMSARTRALMRRSQANLDHFFAHQIRQAAGYLPDIQALSRLGGRIVIGVGATSRGQAPHEAARELAHRLGVDVVEFPGGHQGFATAPGEFANAVDRVLSLS
ncbi:MAG TPA: alpha/beta hydrolase [Jatrophihabitans sp.]|jgi:pimeloyl-ACP methyl ester carboxylesterase|uniref:alpha/beta hydrolase n=1 Tax=Jatrophihabitans sp. TaxID=1932789 RepID=UPI002EE47D1B